MQNSEIKIHGCRAAMLSIVSALFAGIGGDSTGGNSEYALADCIVTVIGPE